MAAIRKLPIALVNQIAAGEVVARPANVVKELVENALDAGATRIDVAIEDGGRRLIAISDDGAGMDGDDLALAFAPHATSKLPDAEALNAINTMGFRGEALASIASISHAHIRTRRRQDSSGYEVSASGETVETVRPCPAAAGTTVTIRDLFFNTPARRKFLRAAGTEFGHITEQLIRLALPHPHVAFSLSHNGRAAMTLPPAAGTLTRAADAFGPELAEGLLPIRERPGDVQVRGLIGTPAAARATGKWQYIFLNGRFIRDRLLSHAIREAYRGRVDSSRWPVAIIFLQIDPAEVDVNVHPMKVEVRFRDGQAVHAQMLAAMRDTLNRTDLTPTIQSSGDGAYEADESLDERRESLKAALTDFFKSTATRQGRLGFGPPATYTSAATAKSPSQTIDESLAAPIEPPWANWPQPAEDQPVSPPAPLQERERALTAPPTGAPQPAIQLHNSYIVAADDDGGLLIIDQHALHERLMYNDLSRRLAAGPLAAQRLLIPEVVPVSPVEAQRLADAEGLLKSLGIEAAPIGPAAVAIQQFPTLLIQRRTAAGAFLRDVLDVLAEHPAGQGEPLLDALIATMACKAAVKAGDSLSDNEIQDLLARRGEAEKSNACPHGRPTTLRLSGHDLQKQFKRI